MTKHNNIPKQIAAALGNLIGGKVKKVAKKAGKKLLAPSARKKQTKMKVNFDSHVVMSQPNPPSSMAPVIRAQNSRGAVVRQPFEFMHMGVATDVLGATVIGSTSGTTCNLDFDPTGSTSTGTNFFGVLAAVANNYARFRFVDLKLEYHGLVPTSTTGQITFASVNDGALDQQTRYGAASIATSNDSITVPVWGKAAIKANYEKGWLWTTDPTTRNSATERQTSAGMLLVNSFTGTPLAVATTFGVLKVSGILEFSDLRVGQPIPIFTPALDERKESESLPSESDEYAEFKAYLAAKRDFATRLKSTPEDHEEEAKQDATYYKVPSASSNIPPPLLDKKNSFFSPR